MSAKYTLILLKAYKDESSESLGKVSDVQRQLERLAREYVDELATTTHWEKVVYG